MAKKKVVGKDGKQYVMKEKKPFYKKVWFWLLAIIVLAILGGSLGGSDTDKPESSDTSKEITEKSKTTKEEAVSEDKEITEKSKTTKEEAVSEDKENSLVSKETAEEKYQAILDEYTEKIKEATPKLVEEYNNEYPNNQDGLEGLATLSNDKVSKLAEISNDGISEMAKVMFKNGTGSYDDYEEWATKLTDVYMEEAQQITDAYMNSAQ